MTRHAVYRFFNDKGVLLYVGMTGHPGKRFESHRDHPRWQHITSITIEWHDSREAALEAERCAIQDEGPAWNLVHNLERSEVRLTPLVDSARGAERYVTGVRAEWMETINRAIRVREAYEARLKEQREQHPVERRRIDPGAYPVKPGVPPC